MHRSFRPSRAASGHSSTRKNPFAARAGPYPANAPFRRILYTDEPVTRRNGLSPAFASKDARNSTKSFMRVARPSGHTGNAVWKDGPANPANTPSATAAHTALFIITSCLWLKQREDYTKRHPNMKASFPCRGS